MNLERLKLGSSMYANLAVVHAGIRTAVYAPLRDLQTPLGSNEYAVLRRSVRTDQAIAITTICSFISATRASARQVIGRLSDAGLMVSAAEPGDRRLRSWRATPSGIELISARLPPVPSDLPLVRSLQALPSKARRDLSHELDSLVAGLESAAGEFDSAVSHETLPSQVADLTTFDGFFELWLKIARAYRRIRAEQTRFLQQSTDQVLDTASYMALYRLHEAPAGMADLAAFLRVDQNTALRMVDRLERHHILRRVRNPSSRREVTISPTEKGVHLLKTLPPMNPAGNYLEVVGRLTGAGTVLAELLQRVVSSHADEPVMDRDIFFGLLKGMSERVRQRDTPRDIEDEFRSAMDQFVTGVAVVTVKAGQQTRAMTVNALTSVSLSPPLLLVCVDRRSPSLSALQSEKVFGVSILSKSQRNLAARFGQRETESNPHTLDAGHYDEVAGVPLIAGSLARIVCRLEQTFEAGSHVVIFGVPFQIALDPSVATVGALGYWRSDYVDVAVSGV